MSVAAMPLGRRDYLVLLGFCGLLFGLSTVSGRPLSVHESVLPQTAREMYADGDWVVPKKGSAPWLESPPLPQWITVGVASVVGRADEQWVARIGAALMATCAVLLTAWMAGLWFGRVQGILSGLILATACQFTRYAWLAEDEIFLTAVIALVTALFIKLEFAPQTQPTPKRGFLREFFGGRPFTMLLFFAALGATNLVKGLVFGTVMSLVPIGLFLILSRDWFRIRKYFWCWGWLAFLAVALPWPVAAYLRFPDVLEVWHYDLGGRLDGSYTSKVEPLWYYPLNLLWMLAPWTLVIPLGLKRTSQPAMRESGSPERFLWCWALGVPLVFSLPGGKHHHYMLHALAPWAILGSIGLRAAHEWVRRWPAKLKNPWNSLATTALPLVVVLWLLAERLPGPHWVAVALIVATPVLTVTLSWLLLHRNSRLACCALFGALLVMYGIGHIIAGEYIDRHRQDVDFLMAVEARHGGETPVVVDLNVEPLAGFLHLFYLNNETLPIPNLSFLGSDSVPGAEVLVLSRTDKQKRLQEFGDAEIVMEGWKTDRKQRLLETQLALYRLRFRPGMSRQSGGDVYVSPMQAMGRHKGPVLELAKEPTSRQ